MDIFSTTSKQVESAVATPKAEAPTQVRQVENSHQMAKSARENTQEKQDISEELTATVKKLNDNMEALDTNVKFGFNDKINTMFVNVMERSSGKMIRKIPTEEAMLLSEKMQEIIGTIFDKKG
ncbi:flagellar protein FlaG [Sulfurospirillum arcachonense]|uniref:flagellar protein FlaG n=1 Tax=Sulfurospirillum arcachonense TaxID=57666 RepID=UPI000468981C|nr:flagellar protein FlaG [Sulfurospirillum arcachonense]